MEVLFGLVLTLAAAVVGVWHVANRDRPLHGPIDSQTLGLPHLQRWSDARPKRRFAGLREAMPFVDGGRILIALAGVLVLTSVAVGGIYGWRQFTSSQDSVSSDRLGEIVTLHARANASSDPATRYALLTEAETAAATILANASDDDYAAVEAEYRSILSDLDRMARMVRLDALQPVGSVPMSTLTDVAELFQGGGRIYLISDGLYEVDVASNQLVQLLAPGDEIDGATVGVLLGATWRGDAPLAIDAQRAYVYDHTRGEWDWEILGSVDGETVTDDVSALGVFDLNLYLLDGTAGRITKFSGGDYEAPPEDWSSGVAVEELMSATDLYIDGNIYALVPNGSILRFFLSGLDALIVPRIQPAFDSASALIPVANGFYIVNRSDGRIARISEDGTLVQQFGLPLADSELHDLKDIVVDESTGIALLLSGNGLYTTRLVASDS